MNAIDQHNAIISLEQSLVPATSLIDSRTEKDWLGFLCDYASLINFYDSKNLIKGTWEPFLLKDPVFLLASISKTRFNQIHSRYVNACTVLERHFTLEKIKHIHVDGHKKDIPDAFNQVFDQLTEIFIHIKRWIYFMQKTDDDYDLKSYLVYHTETNFSKYFWAIISLQQSMYLSSVIKGIKEVDHSKLGYFDAYEEFIWKQNKDKTPYWEILGLEYPIKANTDAKLFYALKKAGDSLFAFFYTIIRNSNAEFEKMKSQKSRYPDATLLRTFVNLLKVEQDQLNGITQKHLKFYYEKILKQFGKPAVPDSVFLCSSLAKSTSTFSLPAGTSFNGGTDAQKNPILFTNPEAVNLNPAAITGGYILSKSTDTDATLTIQNIPVPGKLQQDKTGKVQTWGTVMASKTALPVTTLKPAFAFSSPMLFLMEGERIISIELNFADTFNPQLLKGANYYMSMQKTWLDVTKKLVSPGKPPPKTAPIIISPKSVTIKIKLDPTDPPIESFLLNKDGLNPDGLASSWPMFKIELSSFAGFDEIPVLDSLIVTVDVTGVKTFQLYNDYGTLSTKTAYPPFGPIPLVNSNFIIGSNEIFSKPINLLIIELSWDNLPPDFSTYYQQYNDYRFPPPPANCSICQTIKNWFCGKPKVETTSYTPFSNSCFTVDFSLLDKGSWKTFDMAGKKVDSSDPEKYSPESGDFETIPPGGKNVVLFAEYDRKEKGHQLTLANSSIFGYPPTPPIGELRRLLPLPDPAIQNSLLSFTDKSQSGFMRMTLSGPPDGFGSAMYPVVVSNIALKNAMIISKELDDPFAVPANLPFAPQMTSFSGNYTSTSHYTFNPISTQTYPIQCFLYSASNNYIIYDSTKPVTGHTQTVDQAGIVSTDTVTTTPGVPFLAPINYDHYLFLEITNLLPATALNLYFELARNYNTNYAGAQLGYYYVSNTGWKALSLLSDGTNKLSCSGIMQVNVPGDIANDGIVMPGSNYWLCIAAKSDTSLFAQTVFLSTNGFIAQRSSSLTSITTQASRLAAGTISKPQPAIPQLAATVQPFQSFGGKADETHAEMNQRVSNRLRTKDRAISPGDYFTVITQQFNDIYYAKSVYDQPSRGTKVYVVKAFNGWTEPNAFLPLVSACKEEKITTFLNERTTLFSNISVSNFVMQYVCIHTQILIAPGFAEQAIRDSVNEALNIFLSPWITSSDEQVIIGQEIDSALVSDFLNSIGGVSGVESVSFQTWTTDGPGPIEPILLLTPTVAPSAEKNLLVSCMDHIITFKEPVT